MLNIKFPYEVYILRITQCYRKNEVKMVIQTRIPIQKLIKVEV